MYNLDRLKPIFTNDLVRLGRNRDGGYILNSRILNKINTLLTFGISTDWSFEADFYRLKSKENIYIEAYDYSIGFTPFLKNSAAHFLKALKLKKPIRNV